MNLVSPPPIHLASPAVTAPSVQHLEQIATARQRGKRVRRAMSVASCSAWTIAIFGALTAITSFSSITGLALGTAMCVMAHFEFKGAKGLRRLDPRAPGLLALNQCVLGTALLIYAGVSMWSALHAPSAITAAVGNDPQLQRMMGSVAQLERLVYVALYSGVALAALFGCGGTALYYASRARHITVYVRETPPWIIELQRAGMTV